MSHVSRPSPAPSPDFRGIAPVFEKPVLALPLLHPPCRAPGTSLFVSASGWRGNQMAIDWANWTRTAESSPAPLAVATRSAPRARRAGDTRPQPGPTALGGMLRDRGLVTDEQLSAAI